VVESEESAAGDLDSRYHRYRQAPGHAAWNSEVCPACSMDDGLRSAAADGSDDRQPVDVERRRGGFQRRRLGQLQLKHRLAVDLPEHRDEQTGFAVHRRGDSAPEMRRHDEVVLGVAWQSLDNAECQLFVVFVVALATLAAALDIPPAWLILVVAALSLIYFIVDDRRRSNS